jgi:hypothetical protein
MAKNKPGHKDRNNISFIMEQITHVYNKRQAGEFNHTADKIIGRC